VKMKHIHFIGIGGSGLSAIARLLLERGYQVSGSDQIQSPSTDELASLGARIAIGHRAENVMGAELVIRSSAIPDQNPEVEAARQVNIPVVKRSDFLGTLTEDKITIAVAGTHGKTTTTAMIAWVLVQLQLHPSYIIGGISKNLGSNAHAGSGSHFVIEADEYDRMFLGLRPDHIIITNMEHDHPDCFPTEQLYQEAFQQFVSRLKPAGNLFYCHDHPEMGKFTPAMPPETRKYTYGISPNADYSATDISTNSLGGLSFRAYVQPCQSAAVFLGDIHLQIPGKHNVRNALAVMAVCHQMQFSAEKVASALSQYQGTDRRFDTLGESGGITIINDYAHHPTEIRTTIEAARLRFPQGRIWVLWQPHTYSRTRSLWDGYIQAFEHADRVIVTEIFAAREKNPGFSSRPLAEQIPGEKSVFIEHLEDVTSFLFSNLQPGDVLLVLSAGDANQVSANLFAQLESRRNCHE
jgi:UDP-N-acetylmuramate--alanine ligase